MPAPGCSKPGWVWGWNTPLGHEDQGVPTIPHFLCLLLPLPVSGDPWSPVGSCVPELLPSLSPAFNQRLRGSVPGLLATSEHRLPLMLRRHPIIQLGAPSRERVIMSYLGLVMTAPCHCALRSCPEPFAGRELICLARLDAVLHSACPKASAVSPHRQKGPLGGTGGLTWCCFELCQAPPAWDCSGSSQWGAG